MGEPQNVQNNVSQPQAGNVDMFAAFFNNPEGYRDFITTVPADKLTMNYPMKYYEDAYNKRGLDPKGFTNLFTGLTKDYVALKQNTNPRDLSIQTSDYFGGAESSGFQHNQSVDFVNPEEIGRSMYHNAEFYAL